VKDEAEDEFEADAETGLVTQADSRQIKQIRQIGKITKETANELGEISAFQAFETTSKQK